MILHCDRDVVNHRMVNHAANAHSIAYHVCPNKEDLYLRKK